MRPALAWHSTRGCVCHDERGENRGNGMLAGGIHGIGKRLGKLHDDYPFLGPVLFISSALYFYAQIFVAWVFNPSHVPYNLVRNTISDLGNTACGPYGSEYVCSPRHLYMDVAFIFLGLVMAAGSMLLYQEFKERGGAEQNAAFIGFLFMGIAGVGSILVGIFPENTNGTMHKTGAALAIGLGNLGIFVLGAGLRGLPEAMRRYMMVFSTTSLTALVLFASHKDFGIGAGTMERIAAYPQTIWLIIFGLYILRLRPRDNPASAK
jgi:hypothetical membrane protein